MNTKNYSICPARCKKCKYRSSTAKTEETYYYYLVYTGHRRGCPIEDCDKFEEGKPNVQKLKLKGFNAK